MKISKTLWIGNYGDNRIGIIKAQDTATGEIKFYIGAGKGKSEQRDIISILAGGQKYTQEEFKSFFEYFVGE